MKLVIKGKRREESRRGRPGARATLQVDVYGIMPYNVNKKTL